MKKPQPPNVRRAGLGARPGEVLPIQPANPASDGSSIDNGGQLVETVIREIGHPSREQDLASSAVPVAGPRTPVKAGGEIHCRRSLVRRMQLAECARKFFCGPEV